MEFVKSRDSAQPSRHLFVGNCGPHLGFTKPDIAKIFRPFSATVEVHFSREDASHCYVTLAASADATTALQQLAGRACEAARGRVLTLSYCEAKQQRQVAEQPPVALTSDAAGIPGLQLHPEFVTQQQEQALLQHIDQQPWQALAKRRVQHYGFKFEYSQRGVDPNRQLGQLPEWTQPLLEQLQALPDVPALDQLTVNEYTPGVGLSAHIDTHSAFTGAILSLSLAGGCVMEFRKPHSSSSSNSSSSSSDCPDSSGDGMQHVLLYLPPRSLLVMGEEARYAWQHYIPHRKSDWVNGQQLLRASRRVSLTFRQVRGFPCNCSYPQFCDSQLAALPPTRLAQLQQQQGQQIDQQQQEASAGKATDQHAANGSVVDGEGAADSAAAAAAAEAAAAAMEGAHVHAVYDAIAGHFSSTRFAVWPKVRAFLLSLAPGSVVADVGCGNGKYFGERRDCAMLGSDRSAGLAAVAAQRLAARSPDQAASPGADVVVADALRLPYRPCSCDAVLCIAVLHHISSRQRRVRLLQQLAGLLTPGGRTLVTVWATQQEDPAKTIDKWTRIQQDQQLENAAVGPLGTGRQTPQQQQQQQQGEARTGPDYFVPWHLPFHKAGMLAQQHQHQQQQQQELPADARIDSAKGALVLQRFYHLFEHGELEGLVADVAGVATVDSFYDRSNWCVVFERATV